LLLTTLSDGVPCFVDLPPTYKVDPDFGPIYATLCGNPRATYADYSMHEGYIFKGTRLCIPQSSLRELLIQELHSDGLAGHFGCDKTLTLVEDRFFWPRLRRDVQTAIKHCRTCQLAKGNKTNADYTHLFPLQRNRGSILVWILCLGYPRQSGVMILFAWLLIVF
jgi:hypothetical protein